MDKIYFILGGRPNYIKAWPIIKEFQGHFDCKIIDISQHSNKNMSFEMAERFGISKNHTIDLSRFNIHGHINHGLRLSCGTANLAKYLSEDKSGKCFTFVFGDMDASLMGALASFRVGIPIVHVESGLRSFSPTQKEERNRIMIDRLSSVHFCTEDSAVRNLISEQINNSYLVGNTMIDSLMHYTTKEMYTTELDPILTLHRPENVDDPFKLLFLLSKIQDIGFTNINFYIHPRTKNVLDRYNLLEYVQKMDFLTVLDPLPYDEFIKQLCACEYIITDSGGLQEESAFMKKRCYTLRESTERPSTVFCKSNIMIDPSILFREHIVVDGVPYSDHIEYLRRDADDKIFNKILDIPYWDGQTSKRILQIMLDIKDKY